MNIQNLGFHNRPLVEPVDPELEQAIEQTAKEVLIEEFQKRLEELCKVHIAEGVHISHIPDWA